jgi:Ca2+-binding EF-hand superfamily protein
MADAACLCGSASQADAIFRGIDVDSSGEIQYSEWLAATVEARCVVDREQLTEAFDRIAAGGQVITRAHLAKLLGQGLSKKQAKAIIAELDENGDGVIDLDEFLTIVERREDDISDGFFDPAASSDQLEG